MGRLPWERKCQGRPVCQGALPPTFLSPAACSPGAGACLWELLTCPRWAAEAGGKGGVRGECWGSGWEGPADLGTLRWRGSLSFLPGPCFLWEEAVGLMPPSSRGRRFARMPGERHGPGDCGSWGPSLSGCAPFRREAVTSRADIPWDCEGGRQGLPQPSQGERPRGEGAAPVGVGDALSQQGLLKPLQPSPWPPFPSRLGSHHKA